MGLKHQLAIAVAGALGDSTNADQIFRSMWRSPGKEHGLRLTEFGLIALREKLQKPSWKITLSSTVISSVDLIRLERFFSQPYYYAREGKDCNMYLFDPDIATQLALYSGNLEQFLAAWDNTVSTKPVNYRSGQ